MEAGKYVSGHAAMRDAFVCTLFLRDCNTTTRPVSLAGGLLGCLAATTWPGGSIGGVSGTRKGRSRQRACSRLWWGFDVEVTKGGRSWPAWKVLRGVQVLCCELMSRPCPPSPQACDNFKTHEACVHSSPLHQNHYHIPRDNPHNIILFRPPPPLTATVSRPLSTRNESSRHGCGNRLIALLALCAARSSNRSSRRRAEVSDRGPQSITAVSCVLPHRRAAAPQKQRAAAGAAVPPP